MLTRSCPTKRSLVLVLWGLLVALLVGCTPSHPQSTFDTLGPVARSQATLFYILLWVGLFVFIAVTGAMLYAAIRYRRRPGQGDPDQIHGHTRLEIAWTIAPAILLIIVAIPSIIIIFDNANSPTPPEQGGLVVEAIGHQWWFEFRYPHPDNDQEEVVSANEMHIPVGEAVNLKLDSVDVIHSFWIPKLAGKVDMIPNNENTMWIQADEPGEYLGQCAEFCGVSHANMRFRVIAESRSDFEAWLRAQAAPAVEPADPLAIQGQEVFMSTQAGCRGCHTIEGTRARGEIGPDLTHFASRGYFAGSILENTRENLRKWLEDPEAMKPGNIMAQSAAYADPDRALTEPEISALIAYMSSLKAPPPSEATPTPTATRTPECVDDDIRVSLQDPGGSGKYVFGPSDLTFPAGETVTICIKAETEFHTFTVDDLGIDVSVGGGTTETLTFTFDQPGTFELICIPHEALGMKGTITVR